MFTSEYNRLLDDYCELVHNRDEHNKTKSSNRRNHTDKAWRLLNYPLTVNQFCKKYNWGRWLLSVSDHAIAVVDGVPQDHSSKDSRERIQAFGQIKEEKIYKG